MSYFKGESITIQFTAKDSLGNLSDISSYTKAVAVFTPYSAGLSPNIVAIDNNSFKVVLSPEQTNSFTKGEFSVVLKLTGASGNVKIARYSPFVLADPYDDSGEGDLSIDNGICELNIVML